MRNELSAADSNMKGADIVITEAAEGMLMDSRAAGTLDCGTALGLNSGNPSSGSGSGSCELKALMIIVLELIDPLIHFLMSLAWTQRQRVRYCVLA